MVWGGPAVLLGHPSAGQEFQQAWRPAPVQVLGLLEPGLGLPRTITFGLLCDLLSRALLGLTF